MDICSNKWIYRYLNLSKEVSTWSKDTSTKVGACIITHNGHPVSFGFNGFPKGVDDTKSERYLRPEKYSWTVHAEINSILLCQKTLLDDCVIYVTHSPCSKCAQAIIQKEIKTVVVAYANYTDEFEERNLEDLKISKVMFEEANVKYIKFDIKKKRQIHGYN